MLQEISIQDRLLHISDDKNPSKSMTQAEIEGEGSYTESRDINTIDSS